LFKTHYGRTSKKRRRFEKTRRRKNQKRRIESKVKIEKTIGATTYTKTFTRSDNAVATTLPISAWV
jgi:hypothetical protein